MFAVCNDHTSFGNLEMCPPDDPEVVSRPVAEVQASPKPSNKEFELVPGVAIRRKYLEPNCQGGFLQV